MTKEISIMVEGKGSSKQESFTNAISKIQQTITKSHEGIILRIEPVEVDCVESFEYFSTEKFLFLFMKRKRSEFYVKLHVKARLFVVDISGYDFKKIEKKQMF